MRLTFGALALTHDAAQIGEPGSPCGKSLRDTQEAFLSIQVDARLNQILAPEMWD